MARLNVWHVGPCTPEKRAFQSYALWDPQPVKADECISDVVTEPQTVGKTRCWVEYRLELADQISCQVDQ